VQEGRHGASSLRDSLRVVSRRKWVILQAALLVPAAAVLFSLQQSRLYEASSEVLLSRQNLAAALTDTPDVTLSEDAARLVETQAKLARVPAVAAAALAEAEVIDRTPHQFLDSSKVSGVPNADLLQFAVTDRSPAVAVRLASAYARQFTIYRRQLDTAALERARGEVSERLTALEESGERQSALYATLAEKEQQLRTMEALQTANAFVVRSADEARQVQPRPIRNAILGLAIGIVLGLGLAFLWEALDTRVRSAGEIGEQLGLPLLARVPEPPRRLRKENQLVMLAEPTGIHAEAFRILRTNLELANLARGARTIMVTSAVEAEGKSTTVANLAVAYARAGMRVALVDLNLRRPSLARLFRLDAGRPGLTDVALGNVQLSHAISWIPVSDTPATGISMNGRGPAANTLQLLPAGRAPPGAGEFIGTIDLAYVLERLVEHADLVLIDAPALLHVGDAMTLSGRVDALLIVTRLNVVRRPMLAEVRRALDSSPVARLGFVLTGARLEEANGYGHDSAYSAPRLPREAIRAAVVGRILGGEHLK
jgi:succinoglycan biosynthesis transport protein ExoP